MSIIENKEDAVPYFESKHARELNRDNLINPGEDRALNQNILNKDEENYQIEEEDETSEDVSNSFDDKIVIKKVKNNMQKIGFNSLIPSGYIVDSGEKVEISDEPNINGTGKDPTVIINKNENDEITSIEVLCSCGEKTIIKFEDTN